MQQHNNSTIYRNPEEYAQDISYIGAVPAQDTSVIIEQKNHYFIVGDAVCYNIKYDEFHKAVALNTVDSEVAGIVSKIISPDKFELVAKGIVVDTKYNYPEGTALWLSEVTPGYLTSIQPTNVFIKVATQSSSYAIDVNLERGYYIKPETPEAPYRGYTKEELDEIIQNINNM